MAYRKIKSPAIVGSFSVSDVQAVVLGLNEARPSRMRGSAAGRRVGRRHPASWGRMVSSHGTSLRYSPKTGLRKVRKAKRAKIFIKG